MEQEIALAWEGDSLEVMRSFPKGVREDLGAELRRLQEGNVPLKSRPMQSIGKRVYELKEQDERSWYRVIYLAKIEDLIYVLHCFEKKSKKTSRNDLSVAKTRLKQVLSRIGE
ncbi:MAG: type II toxin-antitoxin system RelE/ParE family toxin [Deltaproteobacteria bacterium]|nr:type II toxin-antitoxin system RelE/ParE family toxin [Deltaproteobacteria bacterium]